MKTRKLITAIILALPLFTQQVQAQNITVGDGNQLTDFTQLTTKKFKLVCFDGTQLGQLKAKQLESGARVKLLNVSKVLKNLRRKIKKAKQSGSNKLKNLRKKKKDLSKAQRNCGGSGGTTVTPNPEPSAQRLGINLFSNLSSGTMVMWTDGIRRALEWVPSVFPPNGQFNSGVSVPVDDQGYPTQVPFTANGNQHTVSTLIYHDMAGSYPAGTYTFSFEGSGLIEIAGDTPDLVLEEAGTYTFPVTPEDSGIVITIFRSEANDPVRNMRLMSPGFANSSSKFLPGFLKTLNGYTVLRFMQTINITGGDYLCSNGASTSSGNCIKRWADRQQPDRYSQTGVKGVAYEHLIDLANAVGADAWFNVQHGADDTFIRNFATLIRDRLNSKLKVYIEFSNEVWNPDSPYLPARTYAAERGQALGFDNDPDRAREKYVAHITCRIGDIFDDVFGNQKDRVRVIMPGLTGNSLNARQLDAQSDTSICPNGPRADMLAVASYFGIELPAQLLFTGEFSSITPSQIVDRAAQSITTDLPDPIEPGETSFGLRTLLNNDCATVAQHNIPLVAYEGGQHVQELAGLDSNLVLSNKILEANLLPSMGTAFGTLFDEWFGQCGGLFMLYNAQQHASQFFGTFGILIDSYTTDGELKTIAQMESDYPKFKAARDRMKQLGQL